jgi:hypothetical protein
MMIPVELRRSIPREVELSPAGRLLMAAAAVLLAAAPIVSIGLSVAADHAPIWAGPVFFLSLFSAGVALMRVIHGQRELLSSGRPAVSRVTETRKVHGSHGHQGIEIRHEFAVLSGARQTGTFAANTKPPAPGSEIIVLYDAETPSRSARYPLPLVRCVGEGERPARRRAITDTSPVPAPKTSKGWSS